MKSERIIINKAKFIGEGIITKCESSVVDDGLPTHSIDLNLRVQFDSYEKASLFYKSIHKANEDFVNKGEASKCGFFLFGEKTIFIKE